MGAESKHFKASEMDCPCCGANGMQQAAVDLAEDVRSKAEDHFGSDMVRVSVNSGYRCPERNAAVGGAKNSQHMAGLALDLVLQVKQGKAGKWVAVPVRTFEMIARRAKLLGGIGPDDERGFLHIDARSRTTAIPAQWCYKGGKEVSYYPAGQST